MTDKEDGTKKPDEKPLDDAALEKYVYQVFYCCSIIYPYSVSNHAARVIVSIS